jgi:MFS family permease
METGGARLFFGWRVVGTAFVFAVFAWGIAFYGPSVFLHVVHETKGWPVSLISAAITFHYLLSAVFVTFLDDAYRRFGIVAVTRAGVASFAAGTLGWGLADAPAQLFLATVLTAAGWAATSSAAINSMIVPWFKRRRGVALSLALNGASMGGVLFVPLWLVLIARWGFPVAAAIVAGMTLLVLWPLTGRYLRQTPATLGLAPDDDRVLEPVGSEAAAAIPASRGSLIRQRAFISLSAAFALGLFSQVGLVPHFVSLLVPVMGEDGAAGTMSLIAVCAVIGRLLMGAVIDRVDRRAAAAGNFAMQACGFVLLLIGRDAPTMMAGSLLFGLGVGILITLPPLIAEREFAIADLGRVVGLLIAINQALFSFAPAIFGALHDFSGGYRVPVAVAITLHLTAAILVLTGRRQRRRS